MPVEKLRSFLDENNIKYVHIKHSRAYTAQEIAASAHVPGKEMAKTVIVRRDDSLAMCVLPATRKVDLKALKRASGASRAELADEHEFVKSFPDCEVGAMPPFGNLYGMEVYVHPDLEKDEEIVFNAGSHTELFRMAYEDFERLVRPTRLAVD